MATSCSSDCSTKDMSLKWNTDLRRNRCRWPYDQRFPCITDTYRPTPHRTLLNFPCRHKSCALHKFQDLRCHSRPPQNPELTNITHVIHFPDRLDRLLCLSLHPRCHRERMYYSHYSHRLHAHAQGALFFSGLNLTGDRKPISASPSKIVASMIWSKALSQDRSIPSCPLLPCLCRIERIILTYFYFVESTNIFQTLPPGINVLSV